MSSILFIFIVYMYECCIRQGNIRVKLWCLGYICQSVINIYFFDYSIAVMSLLSGGKTE